jgi:hypothetical protein
MNNAQKSARETIVTLLIFIREVPSLNLGQRKDASFSAGFTVPLVMCTVEGKGKGKVIP